MSRKRILNTETTEGFALLSTENTERKYLSVPSVMQNSVPSVVFLLLACATVAAFASCQAAVTNDSPTVSQLLVIPQKNRYALNEELDKENDLFIFLVWSDGRHEAVTTEMPNTDPDSDDPLMPNPDLQILHAAFDVPGTQIVYVLSKNYYANYFVLVYVPNATSGGSGTPGNGGSGDGTGIEIDIEGL
jgi:hypothetical protein